ncbi:MAG: CpsD/CapB family tyrosine-protein kinase [Clostridia bacterium]|nr:CpsD/CapB family tyrosine-protein kinase [Clostridia bacterium]
MRTIEIILDDKNNYFVREAFNTLRTNILFSGKEVKSIVVTSCFAHEGKSTISFETARSLAESGKKVLLVDADLRKSVLVSRITKERGIVGLSQLLSGQVEMDDAIYHTQFPGFDIIFAGPYPPNPTELVGSKAFKDLIRTKRQEYDYILVDAAPLGLVIDAAVMASVCDGAIMVVNLGHVKYRMAQNVKEQLEKSGCRVLGVVLNQVDRKKGNASTDAYYKSRYDTGYYGYHPSAAQKPAAPGAQRPASQGGTQTGARPAPRTPHSNPNTNKK